MRSEQQEESDQSFVENDEVEDGMTNQELHQLVHDHQRFLQTVHKLNDEAQVKITEGKAQEALMFLSQAQSILEYAANCGKNIDRSMILAVLHNEACVFQRLWDLNKCSNYLEALIYNMNEYLQIQQPKMERRIGNTVCPCSQFFLDKSMRLVKYNLQFAAVNSQIKNHEGAYESSKKAINLMRSIFRALNNSFSLQKQLSSQNNSESKEQIQIKTKMVASISHMKEDIVIKNVEDYVTAAKYFYRVWLRNKSSHESEIIQKSLKQFSIGNVMQIVCNSFEEKKQPETENIYFNTSDSMFSQSKKFEAIKTESYLRVLQKILILSITYFTTSTQLRLVTNEKYKLCGETKKNSLEFKEAQIYHLISLMVVFAFVPFDMDFVRHITKSYENNYKCQFTEHEGEDEIHMNKQTLKEIDPIGVHLLFATPKKSEIKIIMGRKKSERDNVSPRPTSTTNKTQKIIGTITELQRRCKHIISKKYGDSHRDAIRKDDASKSLTYINKKRGGSNHKISKSCRSKKSLSVTNTIPKKQLSGYGKINDYYSPKRQRKREKQKSEIKRQFTNQTKGYYDSMIPNDRSSKKFDNLKSPLKHKGFKKHQKSKLNLKKSMEKKHHESKKNQKHQKTQRHKSKSKSKAIKGLKSNIKKISIKAQYSGLEKSNRDLNRTPNQHPWKESHLNEYYI